MFCGVRKAPAQLAHGDVNTLDWNANFWVNNYVANQAYNRYSLMIPDIRRVQSELENAIAEDVRVAYEQIPEFADAEIRASLTQDLADIWAERATTAYKQLGDFLFVKFMDGNRKKVDENNQFMRSRPGCRSIQNSPATTSAISVRLSTTPASASKYTTLNIES